MSDIKFIQQANGHAYRLGSTTLLFPYGLGPACLIGDRWVTIDKPERFGAWGGPAARRAYIRRFVKGIE